MNKIVSLLVVFITLPIILFAQDKGGSFKDHLKAKEQQRKNDVKEYAKNNGVPINGTGVDGEYMYLHHINNGKPVYYTTRNESEGASDLEISIVQNEWLPLTNNVMLKKGSNPYLSVKNSETMTGLYVLQSDGKTYYRSKDLATKHMAIATKKLQPGEYVVCVKTANGLTSYNIVIN